MDISELLRKLIRRLFIIALILLFCPWLWWKHPPYSGTVVERGTKWHIFGGHDNYIVVQTSEGKKLTTYFDVTNGWIPPQVGDFVIADSYRGSYSRPHRSNDKTIWETLKDAKERNGNSTSQ